MWSQIIGGSEKERTPDGVVEERQASAPPPESGGNNDSPSILGQRFNYIGRITSKFMEQVGAEDDEGEEMGSEDGWEDGLDEEGWNEDDNDLEVDDTSTGDSDFLSATQEHREVTGKLDNILQEIAEQELQVTATASLGEHDDDGTSLSDKEHQELAVQEIRNEIGQLVDQTPSVVMDEKDVDNDYEKRTTFSPQLTTNHHLVDHTPAELDQDMETDPSIIALATVEDMTRNTNDEDMEGDHEEDYGPVVDQTPPAFSNVSSLAAHVASEADSICDDETDAAGVGGWGDEQKQNDDVALVDHTPAEIVDSPDKRDVGSVEVLASVAENSITGGDSYGLVVDQTPVTPAAHWARSESVIVQAHDDLGTVDETTVARDDDGDDNTLRDDGVASETENEDQLVDYIPTRAESRYGDGSTFAAADPSEVLSVVDGLAPDDQNFGPVVDVTPPPLMVPRAGGEGSTVAFASPSVVVDDSDAEDDAPPEANGGWEDAEGGETPNPQSGNDDAVDNTQLVDFLPPVSEAAEHDTMLVDAQSDFTIGGGQSLLLQGENPREDDFGPVVDQIPSGTHASQMSLASTATQLTYSEFQAIEKDDQLHAKSDDAEEPQEPEENVVVDQVPLIERKLPVDSTVTIGRSLQSEEEEEEEDEYTSKFGPVVDHLPTSRASLAPSRGGSTVDALGAVSEANSDEEEADGWDDEISLGEASDATERQRVSKSKPVVLNDGDRSVSVRFDASADGGSSTGATNQQLSFEEKEVDDTKGPISLWTESTNGNHETYRGVMDKSFAEADTPPSTPHRRSSDPTIQPQTDAMQLPKILASGINCESGSSNVSADGTWEPLENAFTADPGAFVSTKIRLKDGSEIDVDFRKLLHEETTRRKLLEEEVNTLRAERKTEASNPRVDGATSGIGGEVFCKKIDDVERDHLLLQDLNLSLKRDLGKSREAVKTVEAERDNLLLSSAASAAEVKELKVLVESATPSCENEEMNVRLAELQSKLVSKSGECEKLTVTVLQLEKRLRAAEATSSQQAKETAEFSRVLKQTVDALRSQLTGSDDLLANTEKARLVLEEKLRALESEVTNLRASGEQVAELQIRHERDLQEQYKLLDKKSADLETLENLVTSLKQEKGKLVVDLAQQRSLAEHSETIANELLSVAMERDLLEKSLIESRSTMNRLQKFIEDQEAEKAESDIMREKQVSELRHELSSVSVLLKEAKIGIRNNVEQIRQLEADLEASKRDYSEVCAAKEALEVDKESLQSQCQEIDVKYSKALEEFEQKSKEQQEKYRIELEQLNTTCDDHESDIKRFREAESLHSKALDEVKSTAMADARQYEENIEHLAAECEQLKHDLSCLQGLESKHQDDLAELTRQSTAEIESLQALIEEQNDAQEHSRRPFEDLKNEMAELKKDHEKEIARLSMECDRFRGEVAMYQDAQNQLAIASEQQESLRNELKNQAEVYETDAMRLQLQCDRLQSELSMYIESKDDNDEVLKDIELKLQNDTEALKSTLNQVNDECARLKKKLANLEPAIASKESQLLESKAERSALVEENEELLVQLGLLKENLDATHSAHAELGSMRQAAEKAQAELSAMSEVQTNLHERIRISQENVHELEKEKAEATRRICQLESDASILQAKLDGTSNETSEQNWSSLRQQLQTAEEDASQKAAELKAIMEQLSTLQRRDEESQNTIHDQLKKIEDYRNRLDTHSKVDKDIQRTKQELEDAHAKLSDYEQQLKSKDASLDAKNDIVILLTESERQIHDLETKLREKTKEMRKIEHKLETIADMRDAEPQENAWLGPLKEEVAALNDALQATRSRLSMKERAFDELRSQVAELQSFKARRPSILQENQSTLADRSFSTIQDTIARAMKLKRSDQDRAEAFKRLEEERLANASALADLKSTVERYYS